MRTKEIVLPKTLFDLTVSRIEHRWLPGDLITHYCSLTYAVHPYDRRVRPENKYGEPPRVGALPDAFIASGQLHFERGCSSQAGQQTEAQHALQLSIEKQPFPF